MTNLNLQPRTFPARIAELGFTTKLPADWISHELPNDQPDFSDPTRFVPLALVTPVHAAMIFAFVARPAYDEGSLMDWGLYLLKHNQLTPRAMGMGTLGTIPALIGEAIQPSELGQMVVRFAFAEDGGRLINISLSAPELFADVLRDAWFGMLQSFQLANPRGSRFGADGQMPGTSSQIQTESAPDPEPAHVAAHPPLDTGRSEAAEYTESESAGNGAAEKPEWWRKAIAFEAQNRMAEAEKVIREGCQHMAFAMVTADLYRHRMRRLQLANDEDGARAAFHQAKEWSRYYASMATSGGEGAALSAQRDRFIAALIREFGCDPSEAEMPQARA